MVLGLVMLSTLAVLIITAGRRRRALPALDVIDPAPVPWPPLVEGDTPGPHGEQHTLESDQVPDDSGDHEAGAPETEIPEPGAPKAGDPDGNLTPWVEPIDGSCPDSHPVKVKVSSGIFHVPGGASYSRTVPDRCYLSAEAARADGFRAAKR